MTSALRRDPAFWIASGFGAGLAPRAPGTVGSLVALIPWLLLRELPLWGYFATIIAVFALGAWAAQRVVQRLKIEDPGVVVIDEWIGMWITLAAVPAGLHWPLIGFMLFRLFDIWKPWPVRWADRRMKGGIGAMADDALAGVYALLALQGVIALWEAFNLR